VSYCRSFWQKASKYSK